MRVALPFILAIAAVAGMTEAQPVVVAAELYDEDGWRVRIALRDGDALWCVAERVDPPGRLSVWADVDANVELALDVSRWPGLADVDALAAEVADFGRWDFAAPRIEPPRAYFAMPQEASGAEFVIGLATGGTLHLTAPGATIAATLPLNGAAGAMQALVGCVEGIASF